MTRTEFTLLKRDGTTEVIEIPPGADPEVTRRMLESAHKRGESVTLTVLDRETGVPTRHTVEGSVLFGVIFVMMPKRSIGGI